MAMILKTYFYLMSVVSKWRATDDFAAGKSERPPNPKPRYMYRSYFSKSVYCLYHASAKTKTKSHLLVNTF